VSGAVVEQRRDTVEVAGADAATYLQGQVSNDIEALAVGDSCWTFVLEPTGKLGFLARVARTGDAAFRFDIDVGAGEELAARLRRFLLRTKATVEHGSLVVAIGERDGAVGQLVGWWGEGSHTIALEEEGDGPGEGAAPEPDGGGAEAARIAAGWPAHGHELVDGVIPGETGVVPVAVSFSKGCYTGQELVARIDSRGGNVPKHLRRLTLTGPAQVDDPITVDGLEVGAITSVAGSAALGYVHRSVEVPAAAVVGDRPAQVLELHPAG
jgi:folate-binding protein YgfZ